MKDEPVNARDDPGSRAFLEARGFVGFQSAERLHADRCHEVPNLPGVYAVLRDSPEPPVFLARSTAPVFRGVDPTRAVAQLEQRWVPGARVLYFGRACGPGVRSLLKQRIKRYLRFGNGRVVAHWGGRFVWQLADHDALLFAWLATGERDPRIVESSLLATFEKHHGVLPFANLREELASDEE